MSNRQFKPKKSTYQLVTDMRDSRGITFKYTNEVKAAHYLSNVNNYLRTAAFRNNYEKYQKGKNQGKYIDLDFLCLQELSTIDMHYRFLVDKMCSDIEHAMRVKLIKDIEVDSTTDGYDIVYNYLTYNPSEIKRIENTISSPHTGELIRKYFTVNQQVNANAQTKNIITAYNDCPAWVLVEILSFGSLASFYEYYYKSRKMPYISMSIINMVRSLRNAAAHNNCILYDLKPKTSVVQGGLNNYIKSKAPRITKSQRSKRFKSRPLLEFVAMVYMYDKLVFGKVRDHRVDEIRELFEVRMIEKKELLKRNELLKASYLFAIQVLKSTLF